MKEWKKGIKRVLSIITACTMLVIPCIQLLGVWTVRAAGLEGPNIPVESGDAQGRAAAEDKTFEGEINALPDEAYAEFGLTTDSPEEFAPDDPSHPLENYESTYFSELCVGRVPSTRKEATFSVADDTTADVSASSFNLDNMLRDQIGSDFYYNQGNYYDIYGLDLCAADLDGDGTDEAVAELLLFYPDDGETRCDSVIQAYDFDEGTGQWKCMGIEAYWSIGREGHGDPEMIKKIAPDTLRAYMAMAAGDFDGDGKEEIAVYQPCQVYNLVSNGPVIAIYGYERWDGQTSLWVEASMNIKELEEEGKNVFCHPYDDQIMPVVSLSTTRISGQDDLVVHISQPMTSSKGYNKSYGQGSAMGIYHLKGISVAAEIICRYIDKDMQYGSTRMRFSSSVDADVDGDGVDELLVGGYKNTGIGSIHDVGQLDPAKDLLQLLTWNESRGAYEEVYSTPKEVEALSGLRTDTEMMEPAALAAGRLHTNDRTERVFLEGNIFAFRGQKGDLSTGSFVKEHSISLGSGNRAFISAAYAGAFSMAAMDTEQIVLLGGSFSGSSAEASMDVIWVWEDDRGELKDAVTNEGYPGSKGRYPALCPLNVDEDQTTDVRYEGKTYGWSAPTLYSVLQSPPYWSELQYNSETYGAGEVSYGISCGSGGGTEGDWGVGLGLYFEASAVLGPQVLGNKIAVGGGFEVGLMADYVGSYGSTHAVKDSVEFVIAPGEDQAIVLAVPLVIYHYKIRVPSYVVTQEDIDNYEKQRAAVPDLEPFPYKVGDTVPESWETYDVQATLDPAFSNIPVEEYNELVKRYGDQTGLRPITEETFASKTIGDPSTYPHSDTELKQPGNVKGLHMSKNAVRTVVGESGKKIGYEIESETEETHGFQLSFDGALFLKAEAKETCPFVATAEEEAEGGVKLALDGGCSWIFSDTSGMEFSTTICDMPEGSEDYGFTTRLAVFHNSDLPMGDGSSDGAYCIGYVVTDVDEDSAPPRLPLDLRVFATTEHAAVLKWDTPDYRQAKSYAVYAEDNNGRAQLLGLTGDDHYVVNELQPATQYRYAVRAYSEMNGGGNASVLSRWVTAVTKDSSDTAPRFTEQPAHVVAAPEDGNEYVLTAKAEKGAGMEDAALTYQWQKSTTKSLTGEIVWEDLEGAITDADGTSRYTLPRVTAENAAELDQTHYRVVAAQTRNGNVKSIISKIATLYVNMGEGEQQYCELDMALGMDGQDDVYAQDGVYYIEKGTAAACTVTLSSPMEGVDVFPGGTVMLWYKKDGADGIEEGRLGTGVIEENGTARITLNSEIPEGIYELYAVYPGETWQTVTYLPVRSEHITLHVVDAYRICYHLDGGINSPENPTILTNESAPVRLCAPIKNHYDLEGWYLDEAFTVPLADDLLDPSVLTGDVDLYAKWTPVTYTIEYVLNGGENAADAPASYTVEDTVILKIPTRPGYRFEGWYLDAGLTDGPVEKINGSMGADVTLYAKWEEDAPPAPPLDQDEQGGYLIKDYADLTEMAQMIQSDPERYASADYIQTNNINCAEQDWTLTIGTEDVPFTGTYEGNDYYILSLRQDSGAIGGLFGVIGESGVVKALSVIDLDCAGQAEIAGGLAGINRGTIVGCGSGVNLHSEATIFRDGQLVPLSALNSQVNGAACAGGIAGRNQGTIQDSRSNASVNGKTAGGIAGENTGAIRNVYNTGTVTGAERTGGLAGENTAGGSIRYGYNNQAVTEGTMIGGIVGSSENTDIQDLWYLSDTGSACGDQAESELTVGRKTADEIASQGFCDTLNAAAAGEKEAYGLRDWIWSASKNNGYPMLSQAAVVQQTLTDTKTGIQVSGKIHPGAQLKLISLSDGHEDRQVIQRSLKSGSYVKGWRLALQYADGTYAPWEGRLTIKITSDLSDAIRDLRIVHVDEDGRYGEPKVTREGKQLTVQADTLGSFGLVRTQKAAQKLKLRYTSLKKSVGAAVVTQTVKGAKTKVTFASSDPKTVAVSKTGKLKFLRVGTAYITASAAEDAGHRAASVRCKVVVIPKTSEVKSLVSRKKGQVIVKSDKKASGNTGYEIRYKVKGKKKGHKLRIKSRTALNKTIKGLPSGKKVIVSIRAYKNVKGKIYYGAYGRYKTITVR